MCQNHNIQNANDIKGCILFSTNKVPLFLVGFPASGGKAVIAKSASFTTFRKFIQYCNFCGIMKNEGDFATCDFDTIKALYTEFEEMEFNRSITAVLFRNKIYPSEPEVNALRSEVNGSLNIWLENTRRWLQLQLARVSFLRARQMDYHK